MGAVRWGEAPPAGYHPLPKYSSLRALGRREPGSSPLGVGRALRLRGRLIGDLRRTLPPSDPSQPCVLGATVTAAPDHAWLSLPPLHLEGAAATSTFSLRFLAPAARGVPGGLIKFDLFFFFFPSKYHPPPPPPLPAASLSRPPHPGESFSLSPEPRVAKRRAKPGRQNGGVPLAAECGRRVSQAPASLLWPQIYP